MNRHDIKKILRQEELAPKKKLGQNFLVCQQTVDKIIDLSGATSSDSILELGVGLGSLTKPLAQQVKEVVGLEIDRGIIRYHDEKQDLPANVRLVHQDLLKQDFRELATTMGSTLKIMANLPYSISNPLLFKLLEIREHMDWAVLMLQKEVGQRLAAKSGTKAYGVLSVLYNGCSDITTLLKVDASKFHPQPKVDSVVIKIDFHPPPYPDRHLAEPHKLVKIVKAGFQQRRKTLVNALASSALGYSKEQINAALDMGGLSAKIRAEALTYDNFLHLCQHLDQS